MSGVVTPVRTAVASVLLLLLAAGVAGTDLGLVVKGYQDGRARATAVARGVVVEDGLGEYGDVRVRWSDAGGEARETRFAIYATDRYVVGEPFEVRYDPADPAAAYPADPGETSDRDDRLIPFVAVVGGSVLILLLWVGRWVGFRRASAGEGRPAKVRLLVGHTLVGNAAPLYRTAWLEVAERDGPVSFGRPRRLAGRRVYQRVMWSPAVARAEGETTVRGGKAWWSRAVVDLPDGSRAVPAGRRRASVPKLGELVPVAAAEAAGVEDLIVGPSGLPDPAPWWRVPLAVAAAGALFGALIGLVLIGPAGVVPVAAVVGGLGVTSWGLSGGG